MAAPQPCSRWQALLGVALLLIPLQAALAAEVRSPKPLRVCLADSPHTPWREAERDGLVRDRGLDFELIKKLRPKLQAQLGYSLQVQIVSARRCLVELEAGRMDGIVGLSHTAERAQFLSYPQREGQLDAQRVLRYDSYSLFARKDGSVQWDGKSLSLPPSTRVGVQAGHSAVAALQAAGVPLDDAERRADRLLEAVRQGRLAAALLLTTEGELLRRHSGQFEALQRLEPAYLTKPYFVVFSKSFAQAHEGQLAALWELFSQTAAQMPAYQRAAARQPR